MSAAEIECLLHHPAVIERAEREDIRCLCRGILRQSRRRGWKPTERQAGWMRDLVGELFEGSLTLVELD